jgi:ferritin
MIISLPENNLCNLQKLCKHMAHQETTTLKEIAQLLGMMVTAHPAILPVPLRYRC